MDQQAKTTSSKTRYGVLLGALIVQLILGTVYGYSIFWTPLNGTIFPKVVLQEEVAALQAENPDAASRVTVVADAVEKKQVLDRQTGYLKNSFAICILSFALVMVIAGRIQDVKGPRFPAIVGALMMGTGFILAGLQQSPVVFQLAHAAFMGAVALVLLMITHAIIGKVDPEESPIVKYVPMAVVTAVVIAGISIGNRITGGTINQVDRLFLLWGTIGFLAGAGIGFAYVCPIAALVKWFPEKKGLVSGIAVAGFGLGAYAFSKKWGALGYIQEHDILPFFVVHGIVCIVAITIGAMLLRNPPGVASAKAGDSNWADTLKRPAFYLIWLMFFCGAMAGLMVIGIVKPFAGEQLIKAAGVLGDSPEGIALMTEGALAVGWLAIFNAVGRVVWGFVSDKIGRTVAFTAMFTFQAVMMFMLGGMDTRLSLAVAASIVGFNFGGNFALFPSLTADLFGAKNLGSNYGWVFTAYGIAGVVGVQAGNLAKVRTGSYTAAFMVAAVLCLFAAACSVIMGQRMKKRQQLEATA